jgi:hypothetical protein
MKESKLTIAIDFDNTMSYDEHPDVGEPVPHAIEVVKELINNGHRIVLNTLRGRGIERAVNFLEGHGIELFGINHNPLQRWGSPKVKAHIYIDDKGLGCPLTTDGVVDWVEVRKLLVERGVLV